MIKYFLMNDLTSWDNYSDLTSDDEEEDFYNSVSITEVGKKCLLKKYINYVKSQIDVYNCLIKGKWTKTNFVSL